MIQLQQHHFRAIVKLFHRVLRYRKHRQVKATTMTTIGRRSVTDLALRPDVDAAWQPRVVAQARSQRMCITFSYQWSLTCLCIARIVICGYTNKFDFFSFDLQEDIGQLMADEFDTVMMGFQRHPWEDLYPVLTQRYPEFHQSSSIPFSYRPISIFPIFLFLMFCA